jgi:hypothetical protein
MSYVSHREIIRRETERQIRRLKLVPSEFARQATKRYLDEGARSFRIVDGELHDDLDLDPEKAVQLVTSARIRAKVADEDVQRCSRYLMRAARIWEHSNEGLAGVLRLVRDVEHPMATLESLFRR